VGSAGGQAGLTRRGNTGLLFDASHVRKRILLITALLCLPGPSAAEGRTWTDRTGKHQLDADFVDFNDGKVVLRRADAQSLRIDFAEFSTADQQYIRNEVRRRRAALKAEVSDKPGTILYGPGRELCKLANAMIDESSGMACSRNRPGVFWTHNDSGDAARIYAFDTKGKDLGWCDLAGIQAFDWEDMASFRLDGKNYLLLGDTGNNGLAATVHMLYLVEEPPVEPKQGVTVRKVPVAQIMHFCYEDDHRNCEAVAADPTSKTILLVTKEREPATCYVYAMAWPANNPMKATVARKIATLKVPPVTALDISPDGRRAVVLSYANAYEYTRDPKEDWAAAFSRRPCEIVLPERIQGESICYGRDGKTLYLTSEKLPTPLFEVPVKGKGEGGRRKGEE